MNDPAPVKIWNDYDRPHRDLREFLFRIEGTGELLRVPGAHWNLEMGTLAEAVNERPNPPAVAVPGCPWISARFSRAVRIDQLDEAPRDHIGLPGSGSSSRRGACVP